MLPYEMEQNLEWQREQAEIRRDWREIEKTRAKAQITEAIRIEGQEVRRWRKEAADERRRAIYETVQITLSGDIQAVTRNLSVDTIPRLITSMRSPQLQKYIRETDRRQQVFSLSCVVADQQVRIFLTKEQIGNPGYLLKRLASEGITFFGAPAKCKIWIRDLLSQLISTAREWVIPDRPGWIKREDGFTFIDVDKLTWEAIEGELACSMKLL